MEKFKLHEILLVIASGRAPVDVLLKSPKFIVYVDKLSPKMKLRVLKQLSKLQKKDGTFLRQWVI